MTDYPRVLVGVTTYAGKDYILDKCMKHINELQYPKSKIDVVIVDNSPTTAYYLKLIRRGYKRVYHVERGANTREAITKAQNKIRKILLEGDYEYLFFVESDLLIPPDSLIRLMNHSVPVVGSIYNIARDEKFIPCVFVDDVMKGAFRGTRPLGVRPDENGIKRYDFQEVKDFMEQKDNIIRVHGVGFGCTLLRREVIERQPFWCDERFTDKHSDVYFYLDMARAGIPVFVDITANIPHYPSNWDLVKDR
jgi:glycosyltransferase involved in cell wall biosynthesis